MADAGAQDMTLQRRNVTELDGRRCNEHSKAARTEFDCSDSFVLVTDELCLAVSDVAIVCGIKDLGRDAITTACLCLLGTAMSPTQSGQKGLLGGLLFNAATASSRH